MTQEGQNRTTYIGQGGSVSGPANSPYYVLRYHPFNSTSFGGIFVVVTHWPNYNLFKKTNTFLAQKIIELEQFEDKENL